MHIYLTVIILNAYTGNNLMTISLTKVWFILFINFDYIYPAKNLNGTVEYIGRRGYLKVTTN